MNDVFKPAGQPNTTADAAIKPKNARRIKWTD